MTHRILMLLTCLLAGCSPMKAKPKVTIHTSLGDAIAEIDVDRAPISSNAFLHNVDAGVYRDGRAAFYRVVRMDNQPDNRIKIEVVQGGVDRETGDLSTPFIPHETTAMTGLKHRDGTLSLARMQPGSANTEFSICIGDQPELDFGGRRNPDGQGFAAFGRIVKGMEIIRRVQQLPDRDQYLERPLGFSIQRR